MTTYNGWSNYETWNVKLWLDNDEGTYDEVRDMARRSLSAYDLGRELREFVLDGEPEPNESPAWLGHYRCNRCLFVFTESDLIREA